MAILKWPGWETVIKDNDTKKKWRKLISSMSNYTDINNPEWSKQLRNWIGKQQDIIELFSNVRHKPNFSLSLSLSLSTYIYIYISMYVWVKAFLIRKFFTVLIQRKYRGIAQRISYIEDIKKDKTPRLRVSRYRSFIELVFSTSEVSKIQSLDETCKLFHRKLVFFKRYMKLIIITLTWGGEKTHTLVCMHMLYTHIITMQIYPYICINTTTK